VKLFRRLAVAILAVGLCLGFAAPVGSVESDDANDLARKAAPAVASEGYFLVEEDGELFAFGTAREQLRIMDTNATDLDIRQVTRSAILKPQLGLARALAIAATPTGEGLWVLLTDGRILHLGAATAFGPVPLAEMNKIVVGEPERLSTMSATPDGQGLWVFSTAGRIFDFGTATPGSAMANYNIILGLVLQGPVVATVPTVTGEGVYMAAADGGLFTAGDAVFIDSVRGALLKIFGVPLFPVLPIVGIVPDADGIGYYMVGADGGVFSFDAPFVGSLPEIVPYADLAADVVGMVTFGNGYLLVAADGGVFDFSSSAFQGSASGLVGTKVVGIAPI